MFKIQHYVFVIIVYYFCRLLFQCWLNDLVSRIGGAFAGFTRKKQEVRSNDKKQDKASSVNFLRNNSVPRSAAVKSCEKAIFIDFLAFCPWLILLHLRYLLFIICPCEIVLITSISLLLLSLSGNIQPVIMVFKNRLLIQCDLLSIKN